MYVGVFKLTQCSEFFELDTYLGVVKAIDIINRMEVDSFTPNNLQGYHREINENRLKLSDDKSLTSHISKGLALFPTNIIASIRGKGPEFIIHEDYGHTSMGSFYFENEKFWIVDGLHRLEALNAMIKRNKKYESFPVSVLFILNKVEVEFDIYQRISIYLCFSLFPAPRIDLLITLSN